MARKEKDIHYIYKTTCNVTGRWYIGMHSTNREDDGYMGSGLRLRRSIRKYGADQHTKEILEYCNSREELVLRETEIVNSELIGDDLCMNLKCGGEGGLINDEHKNKFVAAGKKWLLEKWKNDLEYRKMQKKRASKCMIEYHQNYSHNYNTFQGKTHSEETKNLMRQTKKGQGIGENNSQYGTCWITKNGVNKKIKKEEIDQWLNEGWVKGRI